MKQMVIKTILFVLYNAPSVAEAIEDFIALLAKLKADFVGQTGALSDDDSKFDELATEFTWLSKACDTVSGETTQANLGDGIRACGAFKDLIRYVIENPDKFTKWFEIAKDLFGLDTSDEGGSLTSPEFVSDEL